MASLGAVGNDREPLSNPYQTHDLCRMALCPEPCQRIALESQRPVERVAFFVVNAPLQRRLSLLRSGAA